MGRKARLDLVLDCADPEKLTGFWQAALDYDSITPGEELAVEILGNILLPAYGQWMTRQRLAG